MAEKIKLNVVLKIITLWNGSCSRHLRNIHYFHLDFLLLFPFYEEWTEYLVAFTDRQESADQGQRASDWLFIMGLPM